MSSGYEPAGIRNEYVLYTGTTTSDGAAGKTTLVSNGLIGENDFLTGLAVHITSGSAKDEVREISSFATLTGTITVGTAFSAQILSGITFSILVNLSSDVDVAALQADVGDASASTLGSLYGIVGNPAAGQDLATRIGYEGATSLADKLTAARVGYIDFLPSMYYGLVSAVNQATGGGASTITLTAGASAVTDFYRGQLIVVYSGAGAGQARAITAYNGTSKVATVAPAWATQPDNTSYYIINAAGSSVIVNPPTAMMPFRSLLSSTVTITSASSDVNLPDVVIANVPSNTTPVNVFVNVRFRALNNTNAAANAINAASAVRIKKSTGTWGVDDIEAITIPDNALSTAASTKEGGLPFFGSINVSSEVDGNATYNLRFEDIKVDGNNLELIDVIAEIEYHFIPT